MDMDCSHLDNFKVKYPAGNECEECVKTGDTWVHLRTCQTCGVTLCCDDSPNQHTSGHNKKTAHPVVISAEPDEKWAYCYADDSFLDY